jgi:hypothetical protein
MDHGNPTAEPIAPPGELARVRSVVAFARATGAPPEALSWLLKLSREVDAQRAAGARVVTPTAFLPALLPDRGRG